MGLSYQIEDCAHNNNIISLYDMWCNQSSYDRQYMLYKSDVHFFKVKMYTQSKSDVSIFKLFRQALDYYCISTIFSAFCAFNDLLLNIHRPTELTELTKCKENKTQSFLQHWISLFWCYDLV